MQFRIAITHLIAIRFTQELKYITNELQLITSSQLNCNYIQFIAIYCT